MIKKNTGLEVTICDLHFFALEPKPDPTARLTPPKYRGGVRCCRQFFCHGFCSQRNALLCFFKRQKKTNKCSQSHEQKPTPKKLPEAILT